MKINIVSELKTIMSNTDSIHNYFAWPSVARLADGKLAAVSSGFRLGHICPFGKCVISYSEDEGETWTNPAPVIDTPLDDRDGGICVNKNGVVMVTSFNNSVAAQRSFSKHCEKISDMTNYVQRPKEIIDYVNNYIEYLSITDAEEKYLGSTFVISKDGGKTFGKVGRLPITAPHGPTPYKDGFLYVGRRFSADDQPQYDKTHIACYFVDEDGNAEFLSDIENVDDTMLSCEPHTIILPDGRILVHIRVQRYKSKEYSKVFTIYQSISEDGGKTFSKPVHIFNDECSGAPSHLIRHSSGVLVSVYGYREPAYGIKAAISTDDGESWNELGYIYDKCPTNDVGYPCSVELKNKNILTVFYTHDTETEPSTIKSIIWNLEKDK